MKTILYWLNAKSRVAITGIDDTRFVQQDREKKKTSINTSVRRVIARMIDPFIYWYLTTPINQIYLPSPRKI